MSPYNRTNEKNYFREALLRHSEGEIQMKIIFIRHAEPDYTIDSLTEKGRREAELLSERASKMEGYGFLLFAAWESKGDCRADFAESGTGSQNLRLAAGISNTLLRDRGKYTVVGSDAGNFGWKQSVVFPRRVA